MIKQTNYERLLKVEKDKEMALIKAVREKKADKQKK